MAGYNNYPQQASSFQRNNNSYTGNWGWKPGQDPSSLTNSYLNENYTADVNAYLKDWRNTSTPTDQLSVASDPAMMAGLADYTSGLQNQSFVDSNPELNYNSMLQRDKFNASNAGNGTNFLNDGTLGGISSGLKALQGFYQLDLMKKGLGLTEQSMNNKTAFQNADLRNQTITGNNAIDTHNEFAAANAMQQSRRLPDIQV